MSEKFAVIPREVYQDKRLSAKDIRVLCGLFSFANYPKNMICFPGRNALSEETGIPINKISTHISRLKFNGWLSKTGRAGAKEKTKYILSIPDKETLNKTILKSNLKNPSLGTFKDDLKNPSLGTFKNPSLGTFKTPILYTKEVTIEVTNKNAREKPKILKTETLKTTFDFFWNLYAYKVSKSLAEKRFKNIPTSKHNDLIISIIRYRVFLKAQTFDRQPKQFSVFLNQYEDWIDYQLTSEEKNRIGQLMSGGTNKEKTDNILEDIFSDLTKTKKHTIKNITPTGGNKYGGPRENTNYLGNNFRGLQQATN